MAKVNFRTSDFRRQVSDANDLTLKNRYFEQNPFLSEDGAALIARPGLRYVKTVGSGPIRGLFHSSGTFGNDVFVASGDTMYEMDSSLNVTTIFTGLINPNQGFVNGAITAAIGDTVPEFFFFCDGGALYCYTDDGPAHNTISGTPANNDVVVVGTIYYKFVNTTPGAGAGTSGSPYQVAMGISTTTAWANFFDAVNASGTDGTTYSTGLVSNPDVVAGTKTVTSVACWARVNGVFGNSIVTTETGSAISWGSGATMVGGGSPYTIQVPVPDDLGVIDLAVINSFVVVIPVQSLNVGRFYWIQPGEKTIDPLDFATAEKLPDAINGVEVFGDQFYLAGDQTTEVWYVTGDLTAPMRRLEGIVYNRGTFGDTAIAINETLFLLGTDGSHFNIQGTQPQRSSTPDIEEEFRKAIALADSYLY